VKVEGSNPNIVSDQVIRPWRRLWACRAGTRADACFL